jgi:hypothetical protein
VSISRAPNRRHYLSTERQNGLGYDPGNPGRLSTALIETNTVEPVRMNLPLHSVRSSSAREMPTLGSTARESRLPAAKTCRSPRRGGLQRGRHAGLEVLAIRPGEALGHRRGYPSPTNCKTFADRNNSKFYFPPLSVCPTTYLKTLGAFTAQQNWFATLGHAWAGHRGMSAPK